MATRSWSLGLFLALSVTPAFALIDRVVERSFPVSGRAILKVDTTYGSIRVKSGEDPQVSVLVRESVDANSEAAADQVVARELDLEIASSSDGAVLVRARSKKSLRWTWEKWPPISLTIEITAPKTCDVNVSTRDGGITVANLSGSVVAQTQQGAIFIGEIDGNVTASSEQGDVAVTACTRDLKVKAHAGNVVVGRAFGRSEVVGQSGSVEVQTAKGPLRLIAESGDVKVGFAGPSIEAADIRVERGDATLAFPVNAAATLDLRGAKITARELSLAARSGAVGESKLEADLNRGGARVTLRASGAVRLLGVPVLGEH